MTEPYNDSFDYDSMHYMEEFEDDLDDLVDYWPEDNYWPEDDYWEDRHCDEYPGDYLSD